MKKIQYLRVIVYSRNYIMFYKVLIRDMVKYLGHDIVHSSADEVANLETKKMLLKKHEEGYYID